MKILSMVGALLALALSSCNSVKSNPMLGYGSVGASNAQYLGVPSLSSDDDFTEVNEETAQGPKSGTLLGETTRRNALLTYTFQNWTDDTVYYMQSSSGNYVAVSANSSATAYSTSSTATFTFRSATPFIYGGTSSTATTTYSTTATTYREYNNLTLAAGSTYNFLPFDYSFSVYNNFDESVQMRIYEQEDNGGGTLYAYGDNYFYGTNEDGVVPTLAVMTYPETLFSVVQYETSYTGIDLTSYETIAQGVSSYAISSAFAEEHPALGIIPYAVFYTTIYNHSASPVDVSWRGNTAQIASGDSLEISYFMQSTLLIESSDDTELKFGTYLNGGNIATDSTWLQTKVGTARYIYVADNDAVGDFDLSSVFSLIASGFSAWENFFGMQIFGGLTMGVFFLVPLALVLVLAIIRLIKK